MEKNEPKTISGLIHKIIKNFDKSFRIFPQGLIILVFSYWEFNLQYTIEGMRVERSKLIL